MNEILIQNPILLLFVVASLGYFLGTLKFKGSSLGVAAVLFTGLAFGAMNPEFHIPEVIYLLGLVLFVYSIGLSSGPAFFESYKKNGVRDFGFIVGMLFFTGAIALVLCYVFSFSAATITGAYAGSTTNTPALAGVIDFITNQFSTEEAEPMINQAVIAYSFSYPMGVLGSIFVIIVMEKLLKIDYSKERKAIRKDYPVDVSLTTIMVEINNDDIVDMQIRDIVKKYELEVVFGRVFRDGKSTLSNFDTTFIKDDIVMMVGSEEDLADAVNKLGARIESYLDYDRSKFDVRRIFVSNHKVVGKSIASLNLSQKYNAVISRIRRGDVEMLATGDTILEQGDRLRFIARREDLRELSKFFGDSYKASSKVNLFSFGLGIGLGLILGTIEIPLGSQFSFKLGYAGGPLLVGLVLGALRRTGPIVWTMPYSANVTLQQIGLILLLAGIGVESGHTFIDSLSTDAVWIFAASIIISMMTAMTIIFVGYEIVKLPFSILLGIVSNQPAILDFALNRTGNRLPEFGYAMVFPIALIMKIVIAQIMFILLI
jgi:putative transport protein